MKTREQAISDLRWAATSAVYALACAAGGIALRGEAAKALEALRKAEADLHEATMAELLEPQS